MSHQTLNEPIEVSAVDGEIVITGPNGFAGSLSLEAARKSIERLQAAVDSIDGGETYQKPLG